MRTLLSSALFLAIGCLPSLASAERVTYYHLDGLGNVRAMTDKNAAVVERHDYLPFGEECTNAPCAPVEGVEPKRFTGKERDKETGLDYFGARYYKATVGRFTTVDPDRSLRPALIDPQRWNRYGASRNNPLKYVDPSGGYFVVAANMQKEAQQYISMMLRSAAGAAAIHAIANDPRPSYYAHGHLPRRLHGRTTSYQPGSTLPLAGIHVGEMAGTRTTLDNGNSQAVARGAGATDFAIELKAFAHESFHNVDMLAAGSFTEASIAGSLGDAPSAPGQDNTTGGTAELRAIDVSRELGDPNKFEANAETDREARDILGAGDAACSRDPRQSQN
jgi:RHS repeat-associated protein